MLQMLEETDYSKGEEVKMIEIGRLCIKTAGRDAGGKCVVVDILDNNYVLIDGETRRRKCNIAHLEPLKDVVEIKKGASHEDVKTEFGKLGLKVKETKPKEKKEKPTKKRGKKKEKEKPEEKSKKKTEKKKVEKKEAKKESKKKKEVKGKKK
jgi:large subunit ribosomal protein L14e